MKKKYFVNTWEGSWKGEKGEERIGEERAL
jgi:hypothetical protein